MKRLLLAVSVTLLCSLTVSASEPKPRVQSKESVPPPSEWKPNPFPIIFYPPNLEQFTDGRIDDPESNNWLKSVKSLSPLQRLQKERRVPPKELQTGNENVLRRGVRVLYAAGFRKALGHKRPTVLKCVEFMSGINELKMSTRCVRRVLVY